MKKITGFGDVEFIIKHKIDVKNNTGFNIPFVRFLGMDLISIVNLINSGDWTYDPEI